jgi:transposase
LDLDSIEVQDLTIIVHLHATSPTAACPQCGTAGSRVHSRYQRTIADVAFGGRNLELKLLVRKWICPEASCSRHIFAERFPEVVQRYARMTNRLTKALQAAGVITNGADAAQIAESFGVPTTAKTIIRRVLQLPLPREGEVAKVGIDEWAWKKGQRYGTILVDLEERRVVQLLAERSVETSKTWLRTHPEIDLVSRDRGKIFREAATQGAPQANQVVDRFHLQKNFAEALEKFFRKQERALKKAIQPSTATRHSAERTAVPEKVARERRARHRQRVSMHKRIWKLYRQGYHKEQIAQLVGVSSRKVYRALEQETPPPTLRRARSSSIVDPYLSYLTARWNQGCHNVAQLYEEIVAEAIHGHAAYASDAAASFSPESRTPRLQTDGPLGQTSFFPRRRAYASEARAKPYERANGLSGPAHPEQRDHCCRIRTCAGLWPEARANARGRRDWSNGKPPFGLAGLPN